MPALAQTKPWRVRTISTPRCARTSSALSSRIACTWRGILAVRGGQLAARGLGLDLGERRAARPAPSTPPCGRSRRLSPSRSSPAPAAAISAARSSPAAISGSAGRAANAPQRAHQSASPAARGVRASARAAGARVRSAARSAGVSMSSAAPPSGPAQCQPAPAAAARAVALEAPRPEARLDRVRAAPAAARWCRCRGGRRRS